MTYRERVIVSAYTGYLMCDFSDVHHYIEQMMGRPVWTHEMADESVQKAIRKAVRQDFLALCGLRTEGRTMYENLVERLNKYSAEHEHHGGITAEAADAIEELQQTVEHYKGCSDDWYKEACDYKAMLPRWIPVTKEPPLKVGDDGYNGYLVYANGYYEVADYTTDKFDNVPYFHVNGEYEPDVTHYMPLPETPKDGET